MGQKVHPKGFRIGIIRDWDSRWFANDKDFQKYVLEDYKIRRHIKEKLYHAGISRIEIERAAKRVKVIIHTAKPGIVIGRAGSGVEALRKELEKLTGGKTISLDIKEIKVPELDAQLVAENIAAQLEKRVSFRKAMKQAMARALRSGAKGIKTMVSGRLGGADIARTEWYKEGRIPLQTLRADIDYGFAEAHTTYGRIGVKTWIYKGDILPQKAAASEKGGDK
ncbi:ribosomal protein S3 [Caldicellulosiruptor kronotskyensis 2002]|uniref:Small ribosomal subunit protein uS3 n=1 Tax=Caldicellulosiruptor kronotskyensis (strain DSM 18902 / VKM B-2412 / 2002) TaxID=632348 RepID=E4SB63_CALK2|nr:30S ribosomal protein S3 [Caldicellulosiruptor kronotskyensis]ADQ45845.1 ribosomal protein S3 [Caldicellulosiruptor kronotskyensis 2002]